jgi:hypothetical protein
VIFQKKINPLSSVPVTEASGAGDCICEDFNCRRHVRVLRSIDDGSLMMKDTSHEIAGEELRKKINPLFIRAPSPKPLA